MRVPDKDVRLTVRQLAYPRGPRDQRLLAFILATLKRQPLLPERDLLCRLALACDPVCLGACLPADAPMSALEAVFDFGPLPSPRNLKFPFAITWLERRDAVRTFTDEMGEPGVGLGTAADEVLAKLPRGAEKLVDLVELAWLECERNDEVLAKLPLGAEKLVDLVEIAWPECERNIAPGHP